MTAPAVCAAGRSLWRDVVTGISAAAAVARSEVSIKEREPLVSAFARTCLTRAMSEAGASDDAVSIGRSRRLEGRLWAAKDLFDTAGIETSAGSKVLEGRIPDTDAVAVDRMSRAGAILIGKARTHEFAFGVTTPETNNPIDLDRVVGGSSGGSAAVVAAGYCDLSLGTDTLGSVRIPAACCGVVGLRPTHGLVPVTGVVTMAWSFDAVGPICRTVADVADVLSVISDRAEDYARDLAKDVAGVRIGVPTNYFFDNVDPEVENAVRDSLSALEEAGAVLVPVHIPLLEYAVAVAFAVNLPESLDAHREWYPAKADMYSDEVRSYLEVGALRPARQYIRAQRIRAAIARSWIEATRHVDVVTAPTLPCVAPLSTDTVVALPQGDVPVVPALLGLNVPASIIGLPAMSVPCQRSGDQMPVGLQIIGRHYGESAVLHVGSAVERLVASPRLPLDCRLS
ncbi:MAG: Asp-tRNA(Asn)/Glu-tRNA(Gln) amidotransferase GatCAB subunit A [Candidatus Nanopelagicales bacterium]|nr:Asp-tRNA(Asn)/Glu-tRNA(Gln) amidotransferase GatCAB subunit A [Candidatus Nanopelagicales bacterium]